ncbi:MAG: hypothetical protein Q9M24_05140 [Mariprofundaceae bacterium]|nr:hypothetical protein [Mariprofundaceae bacterium]
MQKGIMIDLIPISQEEYELRRKQMFCIQHHFRSELTEDAIKCMKKGVGAFVEYWGDKFVEHANYWLRDGSTGSFTHEGIYKKLTITSNTFP